MNSAALISNRSHVKQIEQVNPGEGLLELQGFDYSMLVGLIGDDMASLLSKFALRSGGKVRDDRDEKIYNEKSDSKGRADDQVAKILAMLGSGKGSIATVLRYVRGVFPDPAELALFLEELLELENLEEDVRAAIEAELASLVKQHGKEKLQNTSQIAALAKQFSSGSKMNASSLIDAYQMLSTTTLADAELYNYLINAFGFSNRHRVIDFFEQAIATEKGLVDPQAEKEVNGLSRLAEMIFQLRLLRSTDALLLARAGSHTKVYKKARFQEKKFSDQNRNQNSNEDEDDSDEKDDPNFTFNQAIVALLNDVLLDHSKLNLRLNQCIRLWFECAPSVSIYDWLKNFYKALTEIPIELFPDMTHREVLLNKVEDRIANLIIPAQYHSLRGAVRV